MNRYLDIQRIINQKGKKLYKVKCKGCLGGAFSSISVLLGGEGLVCVGDSADGGCGGCSLTYSVFGSFYLFIYVRTSPIRQ